MVINIANATRTSQYSPVDMEKCAASSSYTSGYDAKYFRESMNHALLTAVVTCDKAVRGVCVCKNSLIPDSCEVEMISISELYRSSGLGRKLLSHALRNMRTLKFRTAFIWVNEHNTQAVRFFTRFGFTPDGKSRVSRERAQGEEVRLRIDI